MRASIDHAITCYEKGERGQAKSQAEALVAATPNNGDAHNLLAVIALDEGRAADAEKHARAAVATALGSAIYLNTLGNALMSQGRSDEAADVLSRAHKAEPTQADILFNLANAQRQAGQIDEAMENYRQVAGLRPGHIGAYNNLALIMKAFGDPESAATVLIEAIAHAPKAGELRFNLGNAFHAAGRLPAAEGAYRKTIELIPTHAEAHANLGTVLAELGAKKDAEASFRKAIALNPNLAPAYVGLADLVDDGTLDAASHRRTVLALKPDLAAIRSSLLMCLHYAPESTRAELFEEHRTFGVLHGQKKTAFKPDHDVSPEKKLRIGVVSGDFRFHAMYFFALPVFEARDRNAFELYCYATNVKVDEHTAEFRTAADQWRDVRALAADDLAALIVRDEIDILIDLSGHAPHNRVPTFAAKPAPLQVAWGDYIDTRGLEAIDILLGDSIHTPPEDDKYYVERVVRFASDYICYRPPTYAPHLAPPPSAAKGYLTFGTFNEVTKIGPAAVKQWAAVLKAIPTAKFLLNNHLLADGTRQGRIVSLFMDQGIAGERLMFRTGGSHAEFLAQYSEVDVILDTTPYSGGLTTCEALLMGVPVLTMPGERFCGRHSTAHLINGGYPEGVAASEGDLIAKARALASGLPSRSKIRANFLASRVCDVAGFAAAFYETLRTEWRAVAKRPPSSR